MKEIPENFTYRNLLKRDEIVSISAKFLRVIFSIILIFVGTNLLFLLLGVIFSNVITWLKIGLAISIVICPVMTLFFSIQKESSQE